MADNFHHFGIIESNKAYTMEALAAILQRNDKKFLYRWFDLGLPYTRIGSLRLILGAHVLRFLDRLSSGENWDSDDGDSD